MSDLWDMTDELFSSFYLFHLTVQYIMLSILLVGLVGNTLALLTLYRHRGLFLSCRVYLFSVLGFDQAVLLFGPLCEFINAWWGQNIEDQHWFVCKLFNFGGVSASYLSVWTIVLFTVERTIALLHPLRNYAQYLQKHAVKVICFATTVICLLTAHFFVTIDLIGVDLIMGNQTDSFQRNETSGLTRVQYPRCDFSAYYVRNGFKHMWTLVDALLYCYVPFCLVIVLNIICFATVYGANKKRKHLVQLRKSEHLSIINKPLMIRSIRSITLKLMRKGTHVQDETSEHLNQTVPEAREIISAGFGAAEEEPGPDVVDFDNPPIPATQTASRREGLMKSSTSRSWNRRTHVLLLISGIFLLTTAPVVIVKTIITCGHVTPSSDQIFQLYAADRIASLFMYVTHASNFYIYLASGVRFRQAFRETTRGLFVLCK
ncbi:hypothetical protein FBUS_04741 [Fasciolopsis buskii]|uniref:G-protein coupled receptors family 1 profile domain-containing protein n=1 Tax=Fasciolopsis buskii TaxID=27845 RepID=A0A8E0RJE7_9TREM|nr:hypothetical protein FBUS_04741 [Fasciolopsis buski]